jgi:hypothetical protein
VKKLKAPIDLGLLNAALDEGFGEVGVDDDHAALGIIRGNDPSVLVRALDPNDTPISDDDVRFALEAFVVYHRSQFSGDHVAVADQACRRHAERSAMLQPSEWGVQESFLKMLDTLVPSLAVGGRSELEPATPTRPGENSNARALMHSRLKRGCFAFSSY